MIIQYEQATMSDINDMIAQIRSEAIDLRHREGDEVANVIIDLTYQMANLLQQGTFVKDAS